MNSSLFDIMQNAGRRILFCSLAVALSTFPALAQDEDEEDDMSTAIKKPVKKVRQDNYPTVAIKGVVIDQATKKPLSGIQLQALGYVRYTAMTEEDGTFTIKVPTFATALYVHAPEFLSQQVAITAGDSTQVINIKMLKDKYQSMYGQKMAYTAQAEGKMENAGVTVDNEISEKLGGDMRVISRSGTLDGGAAMFIRGLNSITADAQPLIVVDGIEMDMQRDRSSLHIGQYFNMLSNIAPDDIEKVTVLKNATALYGARGANGVVLIETKRGHSMATRIDANVSGGFTFVPQLPTMMNATQYRLYATDVLGTISGINEKSIDFQFLNTDPKRLWNRIHKYDNDTDWSDEVYETAFSQNYSINVQGGDDIGMYNLSVGYSNAEYAAKKNNFERMNVRFNTDINILYNLQTKFDISISRTNNNVTDNGFPSDFSIGTVSSPIALGLIKSPIVSPYQRDNNGNPSELLSDYDDIFLQLETTSATNHDAARQYALANPTSILEYGEGNNKNRMENTYFNVRLEPTYTLSPDFKMNAMVSYTLNRNSQRYLRPYTGVPAFNVVGLGKVIAKTSSLFAKEDNFVGKIQLDWAHQFGRHTVAAFVGGRYNMFSYDNNTVGVQASGETNDKNPNLGWTGYRDINGVNDEWTQIQWYGNVDYNYMNRYFATLSLTAEANSRFGENADGLKMFGVQWALFPSVQLGWVLTNESWFPKNRGVNYLRVNAGYDISGNDGISNYAARTSYSTVRFNNMAIGTQLTNIGNDKIQWERTQKMNIGAEGYFANNRIGAKIDYFIHKTDNLLTLKSFSNPVGGINRYWTNGGKLENEGFEATLTFKPVVTKNWNVEVGASVGHYQNKVTELPDGDYTTSVYGDNNILTAVGGPIAQFYGYQTAGVFASDAEARAAGNGGYLYMVDNAGNHQNFKAGDVHFVDQNNDGVIDEQDKTVIGNPNPDIYGNIFATVNWKGFTLNVGFNYSLGNDVYNYQRSILNSGSTLYNQQVAEVGRWTYEGQQASLPRVAFGDPMGNNRFSDRWIEDGSYLRLKTVKLTYRVPIPGSWTWLQGLSFWAEGQNLLTFTKYLGSDPEFSNGNSVLYQGIDMGNLALSRSVSMGVKINL